MRMKIVYNRSKEFTWIGSFLIYPLIAIGLTSLVLRTDTKVFDDYTGNIHPWLVITGSGFTGVVLLVYLDRKLRLETLTIPAFRTSILPLAGAFVFGINAIILDLLLHMPEDLNVAFPISVFFYPAIGFVAEIIFHVIPFVLLATVLHWIPGFNGRERIIYLSLILTAFTEPLYQVISMLLTGNYSEWNLLVIGLHILCLSTYQLFLFIRNGFFHMYLFRLAYYMTWHILWGYLRLRL